MGKLSGPRLRGITQNGRLVCIYSPEDLSVGLVGEQVDGILGYKPETATALMRKILLLASGDTPVTPKVRGKTPSQPATGRATTAPWDKALGE